MSRVLFDAFELVHGAGKSMGIYNYALRLFRALPAALKSSDELVVACNPLNAGDFQMPDCPNVRQHIVGAGAPSRVDRLIWMKWRAQRVARDWGATVYFSPKGFLPGWWGATRGLTTVVTVHDLIPMWYQERYPGYFGWLEERVVVGGLRRTVLHANQVVTHTRVARDDIAQRTGRSEGLNYIVSGFPQCEPGPAPVSHDYLFSVGSRLPHKNTATVLAAYAKYRQRVVSPLPLLVTGIDDPGLPGVRVLKGLSDEALHGCYAHAKAVIFLSLAEGFGYPPLETMMHGTPLICADLPIFHETTQDVAVFVPPTDAFAVAHAIEQLVGAPEEQLARLRQRGPEVAAAYHWEATAGGIANLIERVATRSSQGGDVSVGAASTRESTQV